MYGTKIVPYMLNLLGTNLPRLLQKYYCENVFTMKAFATKKA